MYEKTLLEILAEFEAEGAPHRLSCAPGASILCEACGEAHPAHQWTIQQFRRLEGPSDPSEEVIIVVLRGPPTPCGCCGTLVLGFGPGASPEDADVLVALKTREGAGASAV